MTRRDKENQLLSAVSEVTEHSKCIVIYGSYSLNNDKIFTTGSDIDLFIVFKSTTNVYNALKHFYSLLDNIGINHDVCWYIEEYFKDLLEKNIETSLFNSIVKEGEVLYGNDFVSKIAYKISCCDIKQTLNATIEYKFKKIHSLKIRYARGLSRILCDYIYRLYTTKHPAKQWKDLACNDSIVRHAKEQSLIDNDIYELYVKLRKICKLHVACADINDNQLILQLAEFERLIVKLIEE